MITLGPLGYVSLDVLYSVLGSDLPSLSGRNTKDLPTHIESSLEPAGIFLLTAPMKPVIHSVHSDCHAVLACYSETLLLKNNLC